MHLSNFYKPRIENETNLGRETSSFYLKPGLKKIKAIDKDNFEDEWALF